MSFAVPADSYDRFMGRYSRLLAPLFADFVGLRPGDEVLEVGCGPGALTGELVTRVGASSITAVEPSPSFIEAVRARHPEVEIREGAAEKLPFPDGRFDIVVAQLVVHLMSDSDAGIAEMGRVCRDGGTVAACVWDLGGGRSPLSPFWDAVKEWDASARDESALPGTVEGQLVEMFQAAGLVGVEGGELTFTVTHDNFDEWWLPFTLGVGPAGVFLAELEPEARHAVESAARRRLGDGPFSFDLRVWAARGAASQ